MKAYLALNALNAADATLTHVVLSRGLATEANLIVDVIGLTGKFLLVAVAGLVLHLVRPSAIRIPLVGLGAVVSYSLVGLAAA